ncbi:MAG: chorismate synthase, partial [Eubacteriales bacterium]
MRREADLPEFISGLYEGKTCGAPLCAVIRNTDQHSKDYSEIADKPRPGHADYTAQVKYGGAQDVRGGGHFSGRLTAPICIAGGICMQILQRRGIRIGAHIYAVNCIYDDAFDPCDIPESVFDAIAQKPFPVLNDTQGALMQNRILAAKEALDSVGGIVECAVTGLPAGLGDPMFDGMENRLSRILFGIPAVKGISFGDGFDAAAKRGSENNDPMEYRNGVPHMTSNHAGGILGGITTGMPLWFRCAFKPTPSIAQPQQTISFSGNENTVLSIHGRHDPCIVQRAVPVVMAAAAIGILDTILDTSN